MTFGNAAGQVAAAISNCKFANDTAGVQGGGLDLSGDGAVALKASQVTGCSAIHGGGVYAKLTAAANGLLMSGCTIAVDSASYGGGLFISGTPDFHISGSSITDNWAGNFGGGVWVQNCGGSILGTTISGNAASFEGGGIIHAGSGTVVLQVAKVHGNTAPAGPDADGTFTDV